MRQSIDEGEAAGCLCGAVRLHALGKPLRVALCHCLDCRKAHGAPMVAFAIFPRDRVRLSAPEGMVGGLRSPGGYRRAFCTACGSRIFGEEAGSPEIELPLGAFDRTGLWAPSYEAWAARREPWLGHLPTLRRSFPGNREPGAR